MRMRYRLTTGKHYRMGGERYVQGDVFEPTEAELKAFGDRLEPVEEAAESDSGENSAEMPEKAETQPLKIDPTADLEGLLGQSIAAALAAAGIASLEELAKIAADPEALAAIPQIGKKRGQQIRKTLMELETGSEG